MDTHSLLDKTGPALAAGLAGLLCLVLILPGCGQKKWEDPGPRQTFRNFLMHWFQNEEEQAFEMIAPEDRERLTRPLETLRRRLPETAVPPPNEMLVAGRVDNPYDIKTIDIEPPLEEKPERGETVTLALNYHDGREGEATMVWKDGWYVDLPTETAESFSGRSEGNRAEEPSTSEKNEQPEPDAGSGPDGGDAEPPERDGGTPPQ